MNKLNKKYWVEDLSSSDELANKRKYRIVFPYIGQDDGRGMESRLCKNKTFLYLIGDKNRKRSCSFSIIMGRDYWVLSVT